MNQIVKGDGTVGKALAILDEVAAIGHPVRFSRLLEKMDYPKATLYRFLQTLSNQGMLSYDPDRQAYSLGVRLVRLAHAAWQQSSLAPIARVHLDALSHKIGETVHLAQLDSGQVLYVDKRNAASPIEMYSQAGKVGPAYCTGVGKAMMAFLDEPRQAQAIRLQAFHAYTEKTHTTRASLMAELTEIRESGVAYDREEHEPQIICIAAPILATSGRVIGGLSVTSSTTRHSLADLEAFKPDLIRTTRLIGDDAESWNFPEQSKA